MIERDGMLTPGVSRAQICTISPFSDLMTMLESKICQELTFSGYDAKGHKTAPTGMDNGCDEGIRKLAPRQDLWYNGHSLKDPGNARSDLVADGWQVRW